MPSSAAYMFNRLQSSGRFESYFIFPSESVFAFYIFSLIISGSSIMFMHDFLEGSLLLIFLAESYKLMTLL